MKWTQQLIIYLATGFILLGCSTIHVSSDYDPEADFSIIQTYAWKDAEVNNDALDANPLLKKRLMASVEQYLQSRGYRKPSHDSLPDAYIVIHAGFKEKMRVTNWGGPSGYYADPWYHPWWGRDRYYGNRVDVSYYTEGTLVIDVVASGRKELIWRGIGTGIVKEYTDREKMQKAIDEYVHEILNQFPPGNGQ